MIDAEGLYNFALQSELLFSRAFPDEKPFSVLPFCVFYFFQEIIYNEQMKKRSKRKKIFISVYFFSRFLYNGSMKIWAKLITDGKIKQQFVYENPERLTYSHFFDYLTDICHELDIPTPVLLKTHIFNFAKFNHVKFVQRDFVESLDYDQLFLENIVL